MFDSNAGRYINNGSYMKIKIVMACFSALLLTACLETENRLSKPATSEYVKTTYAGFTVEQLKTVKYKLVYQIRKEIGPSPSYIVEFENPKNGSASFVVKAPIQSGETSLALQSPELPGISLKQSYSVTLKLLSEGKMVAIHKDQVRFDMPDPMLKKIKINLY